jgi:DNA-binding NarL/FixJ family response regulator
MRERGQQRSRPRPRGRRHALTARELNVPVLLAEGLSNAEMASRLTLSTRTVEHHVSALMNKLGVASRGRAVAPATRRGIDLGIDLGPRQRA